ncbi:MAG: Ig-like domain-containing protein [Clostridia bacterium]|nr:Ig-like domain-containing protein [Clostridia bacterium]
MKKNKIVLVLTIILMCVFNISSYVCATGEENAVNESTTTENTITNEIDIQNENIQNEDTQKSEEENKQESEKNNENEENNNEVENKSEQNNKVEDKKQEEVQNKNKSEKESEAKKVQEDKKEIIKSKSISFNYTHTGKMKSAQYIKKKANVKSKKIIHIKKSKKIKILGEKSNFYKVEYKKGKKKCKGYIKKKYIILNTNFSIKEGKTKALNPILLPNNSTDKIKYKSSDKSIAIVNSAGVITAIKVGEVKITATTESGKKDYVVVKVKRNITKGIWNLNKKAYEISKKYENVKRIVYGKSVLGQELEAYEIKGNGNNSKVMFIEAAVHGFEDEYPKDAKIIVNLANILVEYYAKNPKKLKDYTFVIVPCVNPDGTLYGKNNYRADKKNAYGRCTYKGIDINRDFKEKKFKAKESKALRDLMKKYSGRIKVNLDLHGWEDSVLGAKKIVKAFRKYVGNKKDKSGMYGGKNGLVISYTSRKLKAHSALVEFKNSKTVKAKNVEKAINAVVETY